MFFFFLVKTITIFVTLSGVYTAERIYIFDEYVLAV